MAEHKMENETGDVHEIEEFVVAKSGCCGKIFPTGYIPGLKRLVILSWALILAQMGQIFVMPLTIMFIGHIGELELDAVALSMTTFGSKNKLLVGIQLQRSLVILFLGLCVGLAFQLNIEGILRLLGQNHEVARLCGDYLIYFSPGMLMLFLYFVLRKYIICQGLTRPILVIAIVGLGAHILFQFLFVTVLEWSLTGSAIAQTAGYTVMCASCLLYILVSKMYKDTWGGWDLRLFEDWGEFARLAIYGLLMTCFEWWAFEVTVIISGIVGTTELAAQSVLFNMHLIFATLSSGIGVALTIQIGACLGANLPQEALTANRIGYSLLAIINIFSCTILLVFKREILEIFTNVTEVLDLCESLMPLVAVYVFMNAICSVGRGIMRGCGKQGIATVVIFIGFYILALPIGISLLFTTDMGTYGLWVGLTTALIVDAMVYFILCNFVFNWAKMAIEAGVRSKMPKLKTEEADSESSYSEITTERPNKQSGGSEPNEKTMLLQKSNSTQITGSGKLSGNSEFEYGAVEPGVPRLLIYKRLLTIGCFILILVAGVICRLTITYTDDEESPTTNVTLSYNSSTPWDESSTPYI